jgi:hypothetical protein
MSSLIYHSSKVLTALRALAAPFVIDAEPESRTIFILNAVAMIFGICTLFWGHVVVLPFIVAVFIVVWFLASGMAA